MEKKVTCLVIWLVLSLSLFSIAIGPVTEEAIADEVQNDKGDTDGNDLDIDKLEAGDIILTRGSKFDSFVPGYWTHAIMYVGEGKIVESVAEGVVKLPVETVLSNDEAGAFRVSVNETIKEAAVDFALDQEGKSYNIVWFNKRVYGNSYYCSELVWASYKANGVCIDENPGWSWTYAYGVAPTELADHADTYMIDHGT